ncbi:MULTISPECIES: hypothetical protein [unclassified Nocardioides]|uniref:hypothetical protein n=1 Tax=unclassified Nocardioides TaxID=2615069 RepID=UPI0007027516|nr:MULTISPECIES: hypothetical protein [unclassified Nocardioides]KRC56697.1 hypothetical protein ASE19_02400 [Nocardioides sp. Root79]KRC76908.1 hypothetical protein ASE20_01270 [Nocardioides sp. Root240]
MSSTAPQIRRLQTVAPRLAQAALERARLTVVPRTRRRRAPRVPFVTFVSIILLAGVVGLLLFNTSMQQASFRATALQKQATDLGAQQEALELDIANLRKPSRLHQEAQRLGMVIPSTATAVIDLRTGRILGDPTPASAGDRIPLHMPGPKKPRELDPKTKYVQADAPAKTDGASGTSGASARNR